jgi:hypothetical protein
MPLQQTSGNVTQDAYGSGSKPIVPVYVEQVFSTYCYTGNGGTQTITNGINMNFNSASNNWMMWTKNRGSTANHAITDSTYDFQTYYSSNNNSSYTLDYNYPSGLSTTGYTLGASSITNTNNQSYVSWVFGQQKYFFDVVSYSGNGTTKNIAHKLGSVPGCIIVKKAGTSNWQVYHQNLTSASYGIQLNSTSAQSSDTTLWNSTAPTSSVFTVGSSADTNASGSEYTAFIFGAGGTGGFGLTGTQDIISCGSFTTDGSGNATVNLGWEPQWILHKTISRSDNWFVRDNMRALNNTQYAFLQPNTSAGEGSGNVSSFIPTATGFTIPGSGGALYANSTNIYIAIRRGPMATPTTGTSVFSPNKIGNGGGTVNVTTGFPVDLTIETENAKSTFFDTAVFDRLRGTSQSSGWYLYTDATASEMNNTGDGFDNNTLIVDNFLGTALGVTGNCTWWNFARAPGFFDIVCYTGTGSATTQAHNLGVVPQMMIVKDRTTNYGWFVYHYSMGNNYYLPLQGTNAQLTTAVWNNTTPTSSVFSIGSLAGTNGSGDNYVAYLFSTLTGVSKAGSYTGNGTGQSISCGFGASGARFVLIRRTDSTGNWYSYDSANGLTSSSSPYITWNTGAAQTTGNNGVYASNGGFTLGATATTTTNISTASYIFLAIA